MCSYFTKYNLYSFLYLEISWLHWCSQWLKICWLQRARRFGEEGRAIFSAIYQLPNEESCSTAYCLLHVSFTPGVFYACYIVHGTLVHCTATLIEIFIMNKWIKVSVENLSLLILVLKCIWWLGIVFTSLLCFSFDSQQWWMRYRFWKEKKVHHHVHVGPLRFFGNCVPDRFFTKDFVNNKCVPV